MTEAVDINPNLSAAPSTGVGEQYGGAILHAVGATLSNPAGTDIEPSPSALTLFDEMMSPEARAAQLKRVRDEMDDPEMTHIHRLEERMLAMGEEIKSMYLIDSNRLKDTKILDMVDERERIFGKDAVKRYLHLRDMLKYEKMGEHILFDKEAQNFAEAFLNPVNLVHVERPGAIFVEDDHLVSAGPTMVLKITGPIEISLDSVVSASNFDSWEGRKDSAKSAEKIADYAAMPGHEPIDQLHCYILPNGKMVLETENSHRVAAAIKRGDTSMTCDNTIYVSKIAYVPRELKPYMDKE